METTDWPKKIEMPAGCFPAVLTSLSENRLLKRGTLLSLRIGELSSTCFFVCVCVLSSHQSHYDLVTADE